MLKQTGLFIFPRIDEVGIKQNVLFQMYVL